MQIEACTTLSSPRDDGITDRLPLLLLVPSSGLDGARFESAVQVAVNGWTEARLGAPELPGLVVIACAADNGSAIAQAVAAGVRLIVAATKAAELREAVEAVDGTAVIFAPFAEAPGLRTLVESRQRTSVVSCKPDREESIAPTATAFSAVRSILERGDLGAAYADPIVALSEEEIRSGYDALLDHNIASNAFDVVEYDESLSGRGLVSSLNLSSLKPGIIVGVSGEVDWWLNIEAIENSPLGTAEPPPVYFLTERQEGTRELASHEAPPISPLFAPEDVSTPLRDRVLVWDYHSQAQNTAVQEEFAELLRASGTARGADLEYVYDCFYVAAYSALAARFRSASSETGLTAETVLQGLNALVGGEPLPIGADNLERGWTTLAASRGKDAALDLVGGSGDLDFDLASLREPGRLWTSHYVAPRANDGELYCVDAKSKKYCATGIMLSEAADLRGVNKCPCFQLP